MKKILDPHTRFQKMAQTENGHVTPLTLYLGKIISRKPKDFGSQP